MTNINSDLVARGAYMASLQNPVHRAHNSQLPIPPPTPEEVQLRTINRWQAPNQRGWGACVPPLISSWNHTGYFNPDARVMYQDHAVAQAISGSRVGSDQHDRSEAHYGALRRRQGSEHHDDEAAPPAGSSLAPAIKNEPATPGMEVASPDTTMGDSPVDLPEVVPSPCPVENHGGRHSSRRGHGGRHGSARGMHHHSSHLGSSPGFGPSSGRDGVGARRGSRQGSHPWHPAPMTVGNLDGGARDARGHHGRRHHHHHHRRHRCMPSGLDSFNLSAMSSALLPDPNFEWYMGNLSLYPEFRPFMERARAVQAAALDPDHDDSSSCDSDFGGEEPFTPPLDLFELPDKWILHLSVPGASDGVGVHWDSHKCALYIGGEVSRPNDNDTRGLIISERSAGFFTRTVHLPPLMENDGQDDDDDDDDDVVENEGGEEDEEEEEEGEGEEEEEEEEERPRSMVNSRGISTSFQHGIVIITVPKKVNDDEWTEIE